MLRFIHNFVPPYEIFRQDEALDATEISLIAAAGGVCFFGVAYVINKWKKKNSTSNAALSSEPNPDPNV